MKLKDKLLLGLLTGAVALSSPQISHSKENDVKSEIGINYTYIDSDMKKGNKLGLDSTLITDYGAFVLSADKTIGKQRIDPHETNVVTNGNFDRDTYDLEKGETIELSLGYGFKKKIFEDKILGFRVGFGFGEGETDISSNTQGYQKEKGSGKVLGLSLTNKEEDGLKFGYEEKDISQKATFIGSSSNEKINSEIFNIKYQLDVNNNQIKLIPFLNIEKEESDLKFKPFGLDRKVSHTKTNPGLEIKLLNNENKDNYMLISLGLIRGDQRHEFTKAKTSGYTLGLEVQKDDFKSWINGSYEKNSSNSSLETIDPQSTLPVRLDFEEKRKNISIDTGISNSKFEIILGYDLSDKSGKNDVFVPLFNLEMPLSSANSKYETISLDLGLNLDENNKINLYASKEIEHNGSEYGIYFNKKF